jgi:predicted TIM-barrel fold metal-dependent hydrolase
MKVIDSHMHLFSSAEAGKKAMRGISLTGYWGTRKELDEVIKESNIALAATVATIPLRIMFESRIMKLDEKDPQSHEFKNKIREEIVDRLKRYNRWLCDQARERRDLLPFIAIDPFIGTDGMLSELEECVKYHGAKGLKLHPMLGQYYPHDRSLWPIYERAQEMGIPIIFHGGRSVESPDVQYSHPKEFESVLDAFEGLKIVIAHFGNDYFDDSIRISKSFPNSFFDTSGAISTFLVEESISDEKAIEIIHELGVNKVLFGSDFPWSHPGRDMERIVNMGFKEWEMERIFHRNAEIVFGLE